MDGARSIPLLARQTEKLLPSDQSLGGHAIASIAGVGAQRASAPRCPSCGEPPWEQVAT